jgi:UDP-N-acetylglucosamine acyltransferase
LRRRGFSNERIFEIQKVYRAVFQMKLNVSQATRFIENEMPPTEERDEILEFIKNSPRGIVKGYGTGKE